MTNELAIRAATQDDLRALLKLYDQLHPEGPNLSEAAAARILNQFIRYEGSAILLGLSGGQLVTTCTLVIIPNLTRGGAPYGLIENVITDAEHRKRGFGKAILQEAISAAWRLGCYKVMLLTGSTKPETLRFYLSVGFEQSKTGFQVRRVSQRIP